MYLGRIVETGPAEAAFSAPLHPYTLSLLEAVPRPDPRRRLADHEVPVGEVPSPIDPPLGCHFHPRCPFATDICRNETPPLRTIGGAPSRLAACHHAETVLATSGQGASGGRPGARRLPQR